MRKNAFCKELKQMIAKAPKGHTLIIAGDMNAKTLGPTNEREESIICRHTVYHEETEKGVGD